MEKSYPPDSYYLKRMKIILDGYPQHSPPIHPTKLTDQLYIGNQDNADDVILLQNLEITHVLNCTGSRNFDLTRSPYPPSSGIKGFLMIPAQDYDEFNIMQYFEDAIGFLDTAILSNGRAFVHCSIGVNRSGAIVAAYLMVSQRKRLLDVIVELKAKRLLILCNMGFRKQLVQFARINDLLDEVNDNEGDKANKTSSAVTQENQKPVEITSTSNSSTTNNNNAESVEVTRSNAANDRKNDDEIKKKDVYENSIIPAITKVDKNLVTIQKSKLTESENNYLPRDFVTTNYKYKSSAKMSNPITTTSLNNRRHADPNVVLKMMNDSYDKYKNSCKSKNVEPVRTTIARARVTSIPYKPSPVRSTNEETNLLLPYRQNLNYRKKSSDRELANEVQDFLTADKSLAANQADVGNLLDSLISKEDENIIWGKGSFEKDPNFVNLQNKLDVLRSVFSDEQSTNPKSALLTKQLKNLQHKQFVDEIHNLTDNSPVRKIPTVMTRIKSPKIVTVKTNTKLPPKPSTVTSKKHNFELDEEINNYMTSNFTPVLPILYGRKTTNTSVKPTEPKKSDDTFTSDDVLKKISSMKSSTDIKPMSYYRFQVMSERKKDQENKDQLEDNAFDEISSTTTSSSSSSLLNGRNSSPLSVNDSVGSYHRSTVSNVNLRQPIFKSRFLRSSHV